MIPNENAIQEIDELQDCLDQVYRMALASMQSYTFWLYTHPDESPYDTAIQTYGHFFYATHEAHLTMMFISLDCLYDDMPKLINFNKLLTLIPSKISAPDCEAIKQRVTALKKQAKGIGIIRNNSFAHLTKLEVREAVGKKFGTNNVELMALCCDTLDVATQIAHLCGRDVPSAEDMCAKDVETIQNMFAKL